MKEQALTYVRLALSRNSTLKNVKFSPDADGLRELLKVCISAYNTAPNSEEAFSAREAKGLVDYAICVLESDSEAEKALIRNRMKIGLIGVVQDCIRSLENKDPKRNAQRISEEKELLGFLQ